ncbi:MAG: uracil-DNA glycosylase, partial [Gemmataceae bacterium]|nr:uracil-DNA glycosylase [Gemmataceae bacterium]
MDIDQNELKRQVLGHLQSLYDAGVRWLPAAGAPDSAAPQPCPASHLEEQAAHAISPESLAARRTALTLLAEEIKSCRRCPELAATRTQTVFADGSPGAEVCFVGEAPGADEDAQGLPFVGAAGQLLNRIIAASGFRREEVYICNILKCRPPGNRTPLPSEAANCRSFLERQLELVRPRYIVALGGCAATNLLQTTLSLGKLRGRFHLW